MEDAKLEAYYNELKAAAPKGKTGGLGSLRGAKNGSFASAAQRSDAKHGRNAAKPAGTNGLYKMFVKAGEGGFVSYDDDGNIVEEKQKPDEDDGLVGLIPCLAKQRNDPKELKKLAKDKDKLNLKKRKRAGDDDPAKTTAKRKKKEQKKDTDGKVAKLKKDKREKKKRKKEKKDKARQEEEAEIEAVLAAAAKVEAEKAMAASAVKSLSTKAEFDSCLKLAKKSGAAVLVDFSATWCGPCQSIFPVFEKLAAAHPKAIYAKVDADENQESCDSAGVTSFPMFHVYSLGKKVAEVDGADKKALKRLAKQFAEPVEVPKKKDKKKRARKVPAKEKDADEGGSKKEKKHESGAHQANGKGSKKRKSLEKSKSAKKKSAKKKSKK